MIKISTLSSVGLQMKMEDDLNVSTKIDENGNFRHMKMTKKMIIQFLHNPLGPSGYEIHGGKEVVVRNGLCL